MVSSARNHPEKILTSTAGVRWSGVTFDQPIRGYMGENSVDVMTSDGHGAFCNYNRPMADEIVRRWNAHEDMYEALRAWVESTAFDEQTGSMAPVYQAARAAIAKAEGRS